jgi:hypothetical protein
LQNTDLFIQPFELYSSIYGKTALCEMIDAALQYAVIVIDEEKVLANA